MTADSAPQEAGLLTRRSAGLTCALALVCITSCTSGSSPSGIIDDQPTTPSATASNQAQSLILNQYDGFWRILARASQVSLNVRTSLLEQFVAQPALGSMLRGIASQRSQGHVFYGLNRPRPKVRGLNEARGVAVIDDCQDSTHAGVRELSSDTVLTRGVLRNHVVATMHLMPDGIWRVVSISYPKTPC